MVGTFRAAKFCNRLVESPFLQADMITLHLMVRRELLFFFSHEIQLLNRRHRTGAAVPQRLLALAPHTGPWIMWPQIGLLCVVLLPLVCQARTHHQQLFRNPLQREPFPTLCCMCAGVSSEKPAMVLVHGIVQGGYFWNYSQPELGAPTGVKGLFEDAGYEVYNPSLPYHNGPSDAFTALSGWTTSSAPAELTPTLSGRRSSGWCQSQICRCTRC